MHARTHISYGCITEHTHMYTFTHAHTLGKSMRENEMRNIADLIMHTNPTDGARVSIRTCASESCHQIQAGTSSFARCTVAFVDF